MENKLTFKKAKPTSAEKFHEVLWNGEYVGAIRYDGMWNLLMYRDCTNKLFSVASSHFRLSEAKFQAQIILQTHLESNFYE